MAAEVARRAQEIRDELGPPLLPKAYLPWADDVRKQYNEQPAQRNYPGKYDAKEPYDPRGLMKKREQAQYDSEGTDGGKLTHTVGVLQRSGNPLLQALAVGINRGADQTDNKAMPRGVAKPQILQNAPAPSAHPQPIGMTERGEPIYANKGEPGAPAKKGKTIIQLDPRAAVGINERGFDVTARGVRQMAYLTNPIVGNGFEGVHPNRRGGKGLVLERTPGAPESDPGQLRQGDAYGTSLLQREFGDDLKEVEGNRNPDGTPTNKFPRGYLDNLTPAEKKKVVDGVHVLQKLERGQSI